MTKRTTTNLVLALIFALGVTLGLALMLYIVNIQGSKLEQAKITIAEHVAKEAAYTNVTRLVEASASDRAMLLTYFITEKETITFISQLEAAALAMGVRLQTTNLSVTPATTVDGKTTPGVLTVGLSFGGETTAAKKFLTLLENVPYHKQIPTVTMTKDAATAATQGQVSLLITLTP